MRVRKEPLPSDIVMWFFGPFSLLAFVAGSGSSIGYHYAWALSGAWAVAFAVAGCLRVRVVTDGRGLELRPWLRYGRRRNFAWAAVRAWDLETWLFESSDGTDYSAQEMFGVVVHLRDGRALRFREPWQYLVAEELRDGVGPPGGIPPERSAPAE